MSSSYQLLVEKKLEFIIKSDKDDQISINISELLRDLYIKIYKLEAAYHELKNKELVVESGEPEAGGE